VLEHVQEHLAWCLLRKEMKQFSDVRWHQSIHPSSLPAWSVGRVAGGWSLSQRSSGERRGSPWTGRRSITGPHRDKQPLTLTPKDNLESPVNLTACCWTVGGTRRTQREPTHTRGEHADSTQEEPAGNQTRNPLLWGDGADHHTAVQPQMWKSSVKL